LLAGARPPTLRLCQQAENSQVVIDPIARGQRLARAGADPESSLRHA
jgi:hypothetical protein